MGKKLTEVKEIAAGDIGVLVKLTSTKTNDTLAASADVIPFVRLRTPEPIYSLAVSAIDKRMTIRSASSCLRPVKKT